MSEDGFATLIRRLGIASARLVRDTIERPDGRLVDALLELRLPVAPLLPAAINAW